MINLIEKIKEEIKFFTAKPAYTLTIPVKVEIIRSHKDLSKTVIPVSIDDEKTKRVFKITRYEKMEYIDTPEGYLDAYWVGYRYNLEAISKYITVSPAQIKPFKCRRPADLDSDYTGNIHFAHSTVIKISAEHPTTGRIETYKVQLRYKYLYPKSLSDYQKDTPREDNLLWAETLGFLNLINI